MMRFITKDELLKPRPCSCGCGLPAVPTPFAMTAWNKPIYATMGCHDRAVRKRDQKRYYSKKLAGVATV